MSTEEWDALPWWKSEMYLEGLKKEGVLKDGNDPDAAPRATPGTPSPPRTDHRVDYAAGGALPPGFKTRRAG